MEYKLTLDSQKPTCYTLDIGSSALTTSKKEQKMSRYQPATEYAKQIREDLKKRFPGLKFSVRSDYNSIGIALMQAPKSPFTGEFSTAAYRQISHFYIGDSEVLNAYGKEIFKGVNEIVKKYHWDESRAEVDYFCCSFYYSLNVGRWDKAFEVKVK